MKTLVILAAFGLSVVPAFAVDNFYGTSTKLDIGQFAGNCDSMGGTYLPHGSQGGTCKTGSGMDVTCVHEQGITTCAGVVPTRPKSPA